jgi:hypothetical protein
MFIDFATPFADQFLFVVEELRKSPTFSSSITPNYCYLAEMKKVVIPVPPVCEGIQCNRCNSPVVTLDPLHTYEEPIHICEESREAEEVEEALDQILDELEEQAFDDYIDYMLDGCEY